MNWDELKEGDSYESHDPDRIRDGVQTVVASWSVGRRSVKEVLMLDHETGTTYRMEVTSEPIDARYEVFKLAEGK